ncbi:CAP domain-containing protein [Streptomyces sp. NBC_01591]|uniref:CAP domain-containing protein n=1 Tax=Streptomyces sp. NBC_01591 TaxID=2975888 RepID=UPI002DD7B408|nr:CAP domain-containing protein [Streptomyces sp. NBC_01591]WSD69413.1 CAP domain-containing protein [Streptomyces sp. NBC_01591]
MRKHRRKTSYRKTIIAVVAAGAVGIPTAAMACYAPQERPAAQASQQWTHTEHRGAPQAAAPVSAPKASAPAASTPAAPATDAAARVLKLVNSERDKAGCSPLTLNAELTKAAQAHSADMASHENMSHTGSDGSAPDDRITRAGYDWSSYGENVAYGYSTPESVMAGWMDSPGHRANILDCSFKEIGVGLAQPGDYWTQDFGTASG